MASTRGYPWARGSAAVWPPVSRPRWPNPLPRPSWAVRGPKSWQSWPGAAGSSASRGGRRGPTLSCS
eukprot:11192827-Lingulodinium_polyedra.AAC.1